MGFSILPFIENDCGFGCHVFAAAGGVSPRVTAAEGPPGDRAPASFPRTLPMSPPPTATSSPTTRNIRPSNWPVGWGRATTASNSPTESPTTASPTVAPTTISPTDSPTDSPTASPIDNALAPSVTDDDWIGATLADWWRNSNYGRGAFMGESVNPPTVASAGSALQPQPATIVQQPPTQLAPSAVPPLERVSTAQVGQMGSLSSLASQLATVVWQPQTQLVPSSAVVDDTPITDELVSRQPPTTDDDLAPQYDIAGALQGLAQATSSLRNALSRGASH
jgi:hypothetical protein